MEINWPTYRSLSFTALPTRLKVYQATELVDGAVRVTIRQNWSACQEILRGFRVYPYVIECIRMMCVLASKASAEI